MVVMDEAPANGDPFEVCGLLVPFMSRWQQTGSTL